MCSSKSDVRLEKFNFETKKDSVLSKLNEYIYNGWPNNISEVTSLIKPFWNNRDELSVSSDIIFKIAKIVVSKSMQSEMLKRIHEGHLGMERYINRARDLIYWLGMSSQISDLVSSCNTCQAFQNSSCKENLIST